MMDLKVKQQHQQQQEEQEEEKQPKDLFYYSNFINSIKSKSTKIVYKRRLKYFMHFVGAKSHSELVDNKDKKSIENEIRNYLIYLRQEKKISYETASNYLDPVKKFYIVNSDYQFKWDLIKMYLGNDDTEDDDEYNNNNLKELEIIINTCNL
jgi:hypothetical protein